MGLKKKIKEEVGYMKKGAKILPKVLAKKGKEWFKTQVEAAREQAKAEREIRKAARAAEREAFKEESVRQAKIRGIEKAKKGKAGWRGALQELGAVGDSMSVGKMLGVEPSKKETVIPSAGSYLMGGLGEKKKKKK